MYGRQEITLDGQWAKSEELRGAKNCRRCQERHLVCIRVTPDDFWNRRQCTECVHRHGGCTLAPKRNETRKKQRYVAPILFTRIIEYFEVFKTFPLRVQGHMLPRFDFPTNMLIWI